MRPIKTSFVVLFMFGAVSLLLMSCSDEETSCTQVDWVGIYEGTSTITENGATNSDLPTTATVTENGTDFINVSLEVDFGGGTTESLELAGVEANNCSISLDQAALTAKLDLDGNNLNAEVTLELFGVTQTVVFTGSK